ncbi:hypothetical protein JWJ90_17185 [Desulfobulbus rhabdoformis]|uniref:hypothetical protein n=1 Tax=Desulfobulbus rhabdoformis TaxID=34032 RepID=UPI001964C1C1|nr:hypothetical protein [Desulfobulbus rhabdoformis]MBM9616006.1 hypothetical protein [Desulfobulbus rhabdoformis]
MSYACRQLELGRTGLVAESKVKWEGSPIPQPYIYYRTTSTVAYAELCAPGDVLDAHWSEIVAAAISAGKAVGVERIANEPYTALEAFTASFNEQLGLGGVAGGDKILITLSARQQPNKEWHK